MLKQFIKFFFSPPKCSICGGLDLNQDKSCSVCRCEYNPCKCTEKDLCPMGYPCTNAAICKMDGINFCWNCGEDCFG